MKRVSWLIGCSGVTLLCLWTVSTNAGAVQRRVTSGEEVSAAARKRQAGFLRDFNIRGAAAVTGSIVYTLPQDGIVATIEALVRASSAIVVGSMLGNRSRLSPDQKWITTEYDVAVDSSILGSVVEGSQIVVSVRGGRVSFPDGSSAEATLPRFLPPVRGERFLMFLGPSFVTPSVEAAQKAGRVGVLTPVKGPFGLYEIDNDGVVQPRGPYTGVPRHARGRLATDFIDEVRRVIGSLK